MGISAPPQNAQASTRLRLGDAARSNAGLIKQKKPPSLKVAGLMIVAVCRMKNMAGEWAGKKIIKSSSVKKVDGMAATTTKGKKRASSGRGR